MSLDIKKRNATINRWQKENKDRVNMLFSKGFKDRLADAAAAVGLSMSQYVERAVDNQIEADKDTPPE